MRALYAFCRVCDDLVDEATGEGGAALEAWHRLALSAHLAVSNLVAVAWNDARWRHRIPIRYADQLIAGVAGDLQPRRYQTFDDLAD